MCLYPADIGKEFKADEMRGREGGDTSNPYRGKV